MTERRRAQASSTGQRETREDRVDEGGRNGAMCFFSEKSCVGGQREKPKQERGADAQDAKVEADGPQRAKCGEESEDEGRTAVVEAGLLSEDE